MSRSPPSTTSFPSDMVHLEQPRGVKAHRVDIHLSPCIPTLSQASGHSFWIAVLTQTNFRCQKLDDSSNSNQQVCFQPNPHHTQRQKVGFPWSIQHAAKNKNKEAPTDRRCRAVSTHDAYGVSTCRAICVERRTPNRTYLRSIRGCGCDAHISRSAGREELVSYSY